jgi:hypothetical protein
MFRQKKDGDWKGVLAHVATDLGKMVEASQKVAA